MKKPNEGTPITKIDEYIRQFGLTLVQAYDELRFSIYKETEQGWKCQRDFSSKQQLLAFVGGLK